MVIPAKPAPECLNPGAGIQVRKFDRDPVCAGVTHGKAR
jgi:hypothetical protein